MTRDDYRSILDQALKAENGLRLPFGDWEIAGRVRAQLYRLREKLRFGELCFDYDSLTFRLVEGDLCIVRQMKVPPIDDVIQTVEPVKMTRGDALGLPTWPHRRNRVANW